MVPYDFDIFSLVFHRSCYAHGIEHPFGRNAREAVHLSHDFLRVVRIDDQAMVKKPLEPIAKFIQTRWIIVE